MEPTSPCSHPRTGQSRRGGYEKKGRTCKEEVFAERLHRKRNQKEKKRGNRKQIQALQGRRRLNQQNDLRLSFLSILVKKIGKVLRSRQCLPPCVLSLFSSSVKHKSMLKKGLVFLRIFTQKKKNHF